MLHRSLIRSEFEGVRLEPPVFAQTSSFVKPLAYFRTPVISTASGWLLHSENRVLKRSLPQAFDCQKEIRREGNLPR